MTSRLRVFERSKKAYYIITEAPLRVTIYTAMVVPKSFHEYAGELHVNILSKKEFTMTRYMKTTSLTQNLERGNYRDKKDDLLTKQKILSIRLLAAPTTINNLYLSLILPYVLKVVELVIEDSTIEFLLNPPGGAQI